VFALPRFWSYDARTAVPAGDDGAEAAAGIGPPPAHGPAPTPR